MTAHAAQSTERRQLPSVPGQWWTNENIKEPWNKGASNGEDQDGVEDSLEPFDHGTGAKKEQDDRRLYER